MLLSKHLTFITSQLVSCWPQKMYTIINFIKKKNLPRDWGAPEMLLCALYDVGPQPDLAWVVFSIEKMQLVRL